VAFVHRFDPPGGRKQFSPQIWTPDGWKWKAPPEPRPLYGLDRLAGRPNAPVVIAEGEKAADAAAALLPDFVAISTMNGAQAPGKSDLAPLQGRSVHIWPDADAAGEKYAATVAKMAQDAGAAAAYILDLSRLAPNPVAGAPQALPKGWDAADAAADGWTPETLAKAISWLPFPADPSAAAPAVDAGVPEGFELTTDGLFALLPPSRGSDEPRRLWICRPLKVLAVTRDESGEAWGRWLEWEDRDGVCRRWPAPLTLLAGSGETLRTELHRLGLEITTNPEGRRRLLDYLLTSAPETRARSVSRTGWSGGVFVLPNRTLGEGAEPVIFQAETAAGPGFGERGTLDDWRRHVAALAVGNSRLLFAISCAFAAPLLALAGDESGGFHLKGSSVNGSSSGKTTTQRVAASVCGPPEYVSRWRGTDNGLEAGAEQHNDALYILDELSQQDPRTAGESAYLLANGCGKARAARTGEARNIKQWRLVFLSSGEVGLSEHMAAAGKRAKAGQETRMGEIPADAGAGHGVFEDLHGYENGSDFARALTEAAAENYGTPFPAFIEAVIPDRLDLPRVIKRLRNDFVEDALSGLAPSGQVRRVAARFGLVAVAGELATNYEITGWPQGAALDAAMTCFRAWLKARGGPGSAEAKDLLGQVRHFFELHGESRFTPWDRAAAEDSHMPRTSNRAGFVRFDEKEGLLFFVFPEVFRREVLDGFDPAEAAPLLVQRGLLIPGTDGKTTQKPRLPGFRNPRRVYVVSADMGGG
jgi:putative DNA primase/helicase